MAIVPTSFIFSIVLFKSISGHEQDQTKDYPMLDVYAFVDYDSSPGNGRLRVGTKNTVCKQKLSTRQVSLHTGGLAVGGSKELPAVKVEFEFESQLLANWPFLTAMSKTSCLTKILELGTWPVSMLFKNMCRLFLVLYQGTLG